MIIYCSKKINFFDKMSNYFINKLSDNKLNKYIDISNINFTLFDFSSSPKIKQCLKDLI
jgi:hypothetical protein